METRDGAHPDDSRERSPRVSAHAASPDRTILTEEGNCDGWIASDLVLEPRR